MLSDAKRIYIEARTRVDAFAHAITQTEGFPDHPGDHHVIAHRLGAEVEEAIRNVECAAIELADAVCGGETFSRILNRHNIDHIARIPAEFDGEPDPPDGQAWPNDPPDDDDDDDGVYTIDEAYPDRPH